MLFSDPLSKLHSYLPMALPAERLLGRAPDAPGRERGRIGVTLSPVFMRISPARQGLFGPSAAHGGQAFDHSFAPRRIVDKSPTIP
jgi:hypothetical protein